MKKHSIHYIYAEPKYKEIIDRAFGGPKPLEDATVIFSSIFNRRDDKLFMINKVKGETPVFPFDWDMYLMLKAFAKVLVTSGQIMRDEMDYHLFKNYDVFKDQALLNFFKEGNPKKQNIFLLSNHSNDQDVEEFINPEYYSPILINQSHPNTNFKTIHQQDMLNGYFTQLLKQYGQPLLLECGLTTLGQYLASTPENMIDLAIVTQFSGKLPEVCKGKELHIDFKQHFNRLYTSEPIPCLDGTLIYNIYGKKHE